MGFLFFGKAFVPMIVVTFITFLFLKKLNKAMVGTLCLLSLAPLILLRSNLELTWRGVWLSASLAFFCLQNCGAVLEIFWKRAKVPADLAHWLCFSVFFPSLIAGPVGRWSSLSEQILSPGRFRTEDGKEVLLLIGQGIFKKIVFAAPLLFLVDRFFAAPKEFGATVAIVIAFIFRYAIWADISAHTDWAHAFSRTLGIRLGPNFDNPFHTAQLADFWRRWHMSLSQWLQDFVFLPLAFGPLRRWFSAPWAMAIGLLIAFIGLGLWHGITLGLFVMGLYKGVGVLISEWIWKIFDKKSDSNRLFKVLKFSSGICMIVLFMVLPTLLIRLNINDAIVLFNHKDHAWPTSWQNLTATFDADIHIHELIWPTFAIAFSFEILQYFSKKLKALNPTLFAEPTSVLAPFTEWLQVTLISVAVILFFVFGKFSTWLGFSYVNH